MAQKIKIYDITPPQISSKPVKEETKKEAVPRKTPASAKIKLSLGQKRVFLIAGGCILLAGAAFVFIKPKAEIEIWPKKENAAFSTNMAVDGAVLFQAEKTISRQFSSTGRKIKSVKAKGIIKIYNSYSADPQPLIATTRFVSADGKLFRTTKRVVVPGMPGTIDVEVIAEEAGPEYNINASIFSIPGFVGTAKYTAFYGKSSQAMAGGLKTEVSQATQQDLDTAKTALAKDAFDEARLLLEGKIPANDFILMDEAITQEVAEFSPSAVDGQELDNFSATIKVKASALTLEKTKLEDYARKYIASQLPTGRALKNDSLEIKYAPDAIDIGKAKMTLSLNMSAVVYSIFDEDFLRESARNKKPQAISDIIKGLPEIQRAEVRLWPFWARSSPGNIERIRLKLNLD